MLGGTLQYPRAYPMWQLKLYYIMIRTKTILTTTSTIQFYNRSPLFAAASNSPFLLSSSNHFETISFSLNSSS